MDNKRAALIVRGLTDYLREANRIDEQRRMSLILADDKKFEIFANWAGLFIDEGERRELLGVIAAGIVIAPAVGAD